MSGFHEFLVYRWGRITVTATFLPHITPIPLQLAVIVLYFFRIAGGDQHPFSPIISKGFMENSRTLISQKA